jgi:hypothetical protein
VIVVGVDNGLDGGIAILTFDDKMRMWPAPIMHVMPVLEHKAKRQIYASGVADILRRLPLDETHVYIERASTRPGLGAQSVFNYGVGYGVIQGVTATLRLPHTLVTPAAWSKMMHAGCAGGDTKSRSAEAAMRLFPGVDFRASPRSKKPHDGLTEATLIAAYGLHILSRGVA